MQRSEPNSHCTETNIVDLATRFFVGGSGFILARVNTVKQTPVKTFVNVDAGFNTLLEHTNYHWYYRTIVASRAGEEADAEFRLAGLWRRRVRCGGGRVLDRLRGPAAGILRDSRVKSRGRGDQPVRQRHTRGYPGDRTLTHSYDRLGRLKELSFVTGMGPALASAFDYDKAGRLTGRSYPNGIQQSNGFDQSGRLTSLNYQQDSTTLIALSYAYDHNGNKTGGSETGTLSWQPTALPAEQTAKLRAGS